MIGRANPARVIWPRGTGTAPVRLVVAAVRPARPNPSVLTVAARAAQDQDAHLLVLGTIRPVLIDYTQMMEHEALPLEAAGAELFAEAVESLYAFELPWSVHVLVGHPARRITELAQHCELRTVVTGRSQRRRQWWRKLGDQPTVVVTA